MWYLEIVEYQEILVNNKIIRVLSLKRKLLHMSLLM